MRLNEKTPRCAVLAKLLRNPPPGVLVEVRGQMVRLQGGSEQVTMALDGQLTAAERNRLVHAARQSTVGSLRFASTHC